MKLALPSGAIDDHVLLMINMVLQANGLDPISRRDRIRGFTTIPAEAANNVAMSLKTLGLAA